MTDTTKRECRACGGKGFVIVPVFSQVAHRRFTPAEVKKVFDLYKEGRSLRVIAKAANIPHPQTVKNLIIRELNK